MPNDNQVASAVARGQLAHTVVAGVVVEVRGVPGNHMEYASNWGKELGLGTFGRAGTVEVVPVMHPS
eukprot:COSAG01_NODE_2959_length_6793_cov_16.043771_5_plen_67_part_00